MAKRVIEPVAWATRAVNAEMEKTGFPWWDWMDGAVWQLTQGEDYVIKTPSMKAKIYKVGKREGRRVRLMMDTTSQPETITFQFIKDAELDRLPTARHRLPQRH